MALYATRPLGGEGADDHEVALRVALAVAGGPEEARARGMALLIEACPRAESWTNHHVSASPVGREQLRALFDALSGDSTEEGGADFPELIM
jgi:hypothetical protein